MSEGKARIESSLSQMNWILFSVVSKLIYIGREVGYDVGCNGDRKVAG